MASAPEGFDIARLQAWMDAHGLPGGEVTGLRILTGGTQNILLRFDRAGRGYVLRQPPPFSIAGAGRTVLREAQAIGALARTDVPHARLVATCADAAVTGGPFFIMEEIEGFNAGVGMPALHAASPGIRNRMGFAVVDALAAIRAVDYVAVGLADFGKPEGFLERQVDRWRSQLEGYAQFEGWPGPAGLPAVDPIRKWLDANLPPSFKPGLMHGDFHLKNLLFHNDGPEVAAVIDWELATIGDPLVDLGWLLATWPGPNGDYTSFIIEPWDGFPSGEEIVHYYGSVTGQALDHVLWYQVFACYKLALIIEGTFARACAGKADMAVGERLHGNARRLLARADRWLAA